MSELVAGIADASAELPGWRERRLPERHPQAVGLTAPNASPGPVGAAVRRPRRLGSSVRGATLATL